MTGRQRPPKSKIKVALEAIKGDMTLSEATSENAIQPSLAAQWRDPLSGEGAEDVFGKNRQKLGRKKQAKADKKEQDELLRAIGQPTGECCFP